MKWRQGFLWALSVSWLVSCSDSNVEQIPVQVPAHVKVPEEMVYIPAGEFKYGHAEDPRLPLVEKFF